MYPIQRQADVYGIFEPQDRPERTAAVSQSEVADLLRGPSIMAGLNVRHREAAVGGTPEELWRQDFNTSVNNLSGFPPSEENYRAMEHLKGRDWEEMLKRDSGTFDYSKHPLHDFGDQTRHEPFDGRPEHSQVQEWPRGSGQGWMPGNGIDSPSHLHPYHGPYTPNRRQYPDTR
jgi:hypothetical protein